MSATGVVAALPREARALGPAIGSRSGCDVLARGFLRIVSGMGCDAAGTAARRLADAGATALLSWGVAGALDPQLAAGTVCLPREILAVDGLRYATSADWRDALRAELGNRLPVACGVLVTRDAPLASVAGKAALHRESGAVAVDMESAAIAAVAAARHIPFLAVRVIVDTALHAIPAAVAAASGPGDVRIGRLLAGLARSPGEIGAVFRLGRRFTLALRALQTIARFEALAPPRTQGAGREARA